MRMCNCSNSRDKWRHFDKGSKLCMDPRDSRSLLPCDLSHKDSCIEQPNSGMSRCFDKETTSIRQYLPNSSDLVTNKWNKLLSNDFIMLRFIMYQSFIFHLHSPVRLSSVQSSPVQFSSVFFIFQTSYLQNHFYIYTCSY